MLSTNSRSNKLPPVPASMAADLRWLQNKWTRVRRDTTQIKGRERFLRRAHKCYETGMPLELLARYIGCSAAFLSTSFRELKLGIRLCSTRTPFAAPPKRQYTGANDYFSKIDSEGKAYFLGLLFADGNVVVKRGRAQGVRLRIKAADRELLVQIREHIGSDAIIRDAISNNTRQVHLCLWSCRMGDDLLRHGVEPWRAQLNTKPPELASHLVSSFWRGVFDGDGHIQRSTITKFALGGWEIGLCGNLSTVTAFTCFVNAETGLRKPSIHKNGYSKYCWKVSFSGPSALIVANLLYPEDSSTLGLGRKRRPAQLLSTYFKLCIRWGLTVAERGDGLRFTNTHPSKMPLGVAALVRQLGRELERGGYRHTASPKL